MSFTHDFKPQIPSWSQDDSADCVAVYRVKSPRWGLAALDHFHGANTITHAVVGGHGSDSTKEDGVLVMSRPVTGILRANNGTVSEFNAGICSKTLDEELGM